MNHCSKCNCSKPASDFYKNSKTGQLHSWCKECLKAYFRDRAKSHKAKSKQGVRKSRKFEADIMTISPEQQAKNKRRFIRKLWRK